MDKIIISDGLNGMTNPKSRLFTLSAPQGTRRKGDASYVLLIDGEIASERLPEMELVKHIENIALPSDRLVYGQAIAVPTSIYNWATYRRRSNEFWDKIRCESRQKYLDMIELARFRGEEPDSIALMIARSQVEETVPKYLNYLERFKTSKGKDWDSKLSSDMYQVLNAVAEDRRNRNFAEESIRSLVSEFRNIKMDNQDDQTEVDNVYLTTIEIIKIMVYR